MRLTKMAILVRFWYLIKQEYPHTCMMDMTDTARATSIENNTLTAYVVLIFNPKNFDSWVVISTCSRTNRFFMFNCDHPPPPPSPRERGSLYYDPIVLRIKFGNRKSSCISANKHKFICCNLMTTLFL